MLSPAICEICYSLGSLKTSQLCLHSIPKVVKHNCKKFAYNLGNGLTVVEAALATGPDPLGEGEFQQHS